MVRVSMNVEMKLTGMALFFMITQIQGKIDIVEYNYGLCYALLFLNAVLGIWQLFNIICTLVPQRP